MSSTNKTTYYELSQYVGTDIINPLTDFNGDNEKIDTALHNIAEVAGAGAADITALTGRVTTDEGKITALETQNGSDVLVTTAQTLSGAINELKSVNDTQSSTLSAHTASIDNINARTTANENAITTINSTLSSKYLLEDIVDLSDPYNNTSWKGAINSAMTKLKDYLATLDADEYLEVLELHLWDYEYYPEKSEHLISKTSADSELYFKGTSTDINTSRARIGTVIADASDSTASSHVVATINTTGTTLADISDNTFGADNIPVGFIVKKYKKVG